MPGFSFSYSSAVVARTRKTGQFEFEYRFTKHEHEKLIFDGRLQREVPNGFGVEALLVDVSSSDGASVYHLSDFGADG